MPSSYLIDSENRVVRCRAWGVFTFAEATATRLQFANDPAFADEFSQIYDFSEVDRLDMRAEEIRSLAGSSPFAARARRAAVAPQTAVFGALRMFSIQHEASGGNSQVRVFKSASDAETWLGIPAECAAKWESVFAGRVGGEGAGPD